MRIIVVVGARPNFIKVAPLIPAFRAAGIDAQLAHTGQHYDPMMSDIFFQDLDIPKPSWSLGVGSGTHAVQTGAAMVAIEELLEAERPDAVMVVGDVNSTLAGALAAAKIGVPVVHLEAGLRSGDMSMPEEVNRLVTDQLSAMLLTPVVGAAENLLREGVDERRIHFVGNVMAESALRNMPRIEGRAIPHADEVGTCDFILATIHRPENTDHAERVTAIHAALSSAPLPVLLPVHPRARTVLSDLAADSPNVHLVDPVGYLDMLTLQRAASIVVTDSGGVQEEACLLGTPCVTVRRSTERQVTLEVGSNRLVDAAVESVARGIEEALLSDTAWVLPARWDLEVSARVVEALESGILPLRGPA